MNNSVLKYNNYDLETKVVDYTSFNYTLLLNMPELELSDYIEYYSMQDDEKIESISQKLYGTPVYWDLLLLINGYSPLFDMSYSYELLEEKVTDISQDYLNLFTNLSNNFIYNFNEKILKEITEKNESLRLIKVISPNKIQAFLKLARDKGYI